MRQVYFFGAGVLLLLGLLALSSFVAAAPPPPPTPASDSAIAPEGDDPAALDVAALPKAPVNPGTMTSRILVINPDTSGPAAVSVKIVKPDGTDAYTFPTFTLPVDGAAVKALPASIASPFAGSAVVSSDRNVQAYVTTANSSNAARDLYAGTASPTAGLTLPLLRHLASDTQNSIVAVQNTGGSATTLTLHVFDAGGTEVKTQSTASPIAPLASAYFNTNNLSLSAPFIGSATITGDGTTGLGAAVQTRYVKDTASFRALNSTDQSQTLFLSFVERRLTSTGAPLNWNELYVRNNGAGPTTVTAEYYNMSGIKLLTTTAPQPVPQNGLVIFSTADPSFKSLGTNFKGWVKLTSDLQNPQPIAAYSLENWNSGTRLFGMEGIPAEQLSTKYLCGDVVKNANQTSRIVVVNTDTTTAAAVTIKLYSATTGKAVGTKSVSVPARRGVTVSSTDTVFSGAGSTYEGLALISSNGPQIISTVYTPWSNSVGPGGVTSYACNRLP